jgi:hypothetical protein
MTMLAYTIDAGQRLITITGEYAGPGEWKDILGRVLTDPDRQPGFVMLRDLRHATTPTDAETVVEVINVVREFWSKLQLSRYAVVTPLSMDPAALVAQALADREEIPMRIFMTYEEAMLWLRQSE